jgi:hypothetical protein
MKTKFYWVALLASAAMIAQANAGGHHGGGGGMGGGFGGGFAGGRSAPAPGGGFSSFHSMPMRGFGGGMGYRGFRDPSFGMRSAAPGTFRSYYINPNGGRQLGARQFASGNINRGDHFTRLSNRGNQAVTSLRRDRTGAGQFRNGNNNLRPDWRNHVFAHRSGDWHRDWDRGRDHWWNGHRCRFIDGSWVVFDFGFYPWWYDSYPYDYYGYNYYPYAYGDDPSYYDSGDYDAGDYYYGQNAYDSSDPHTDSSVAAAQERLAQQGYYRGDIDGVLGPETSRAIARYQTEHGLRVTGLLTTDTLQALGLRRVARS